MAAGDSAKRLLPFEVFQSSCRASISPKDLWFSEKAEDDSPSNTQSRFLVCTLPPFLHTVLNFYSFSSFLPFDGFLCVQAVGKFSVMVRSSTTGNHPPSPLHLRHIGTHPPPFTLSLWRVPHVSVPLPVPQQRPRPEWSLIQNRYLLIWAHWQEINQHLTRKLDPLLFLKKGPILQILFLLLASNLQRNCT